MDFRLASAIRRGLYSIAVGTVDLVGRAMSKEIEARIALLEKHKKVEAQELKNIYKLLTDLEKRVNGTKKIHTGEVSPFGPPVELNALRIQVDELTRTNHELAAQNAYLKTTVDELHNQVAAYRRTAHREQVNRLAYQDLLGDLMSLLNDGVARLEKVKEDG